MPQLAHIDLQCGLNVLVTEKRRNARRGLSLFVGHRESFAGQSNVMP